MNTNTRHAITLTYLGFPASGPTVQTVRRAGLGSLTLAARSEIRTQLGRSTDPLALELTAALEELDGPATVRSGAPSHMSA